MVAEQRGGSAASLVDAIIPLIMEEIVEAINAVPRTRIAKRICEHIVDVDGSQVAKQDTEVPKTSSRDRTSQCTLEQILNVPVPEMVTQLVDVPNIVSQDRIKQRVRFPVPQVVEELAEISKFFFTEWSSTAFRGANHRDPLLFQLLERSLRCLSLRRRKQAANTHVPHVVNAVEVEKHIIQEKINRETKWIEIPPLQFMDKAIDIPVVAQRQVPQVHVVKKTVEDPQFEMVQKNR